MRLPTEPRRTILFLVLIEVLWLVGLSLVMPLAIFGVPPVLLVLVFVVGLRKGREVFATKGIWLRWLLAWIVSQVGLGILCIYTRVWELGALSFFASPLLAAAAVLSSALAEPEEVE